MRERLAAADVKVSKPMSVSRLQAATRPDQPRSAKTLAETRILLEDLADFQVSFTETVHAPIEVEWDLPTPPDRTLRVRRTRACLRYRRRETDARGSAEV
jgi:hypothetical protein